MTDEEAMQLLRLLDKYFDESEENPRRLIACNLVDDLAMSMSPTPNEADEIRQRIGA